jgi:hypothetical protein
MLQRRFLAAAITSMALAGIDTTGAAQGAKRAEKPGWVNLFDGATLDGWGDFDAEFEVLTHTGANPASTSTPRSRIAAGPTAASRCR